MAGNLFALDAKAMASPVPGLREGGGALKAQPVQPGQTEYLPLRWDQTRPGVAYLVFPGPLIRTNH